MPLWKSCPLFFSLSRNRVISDPLFMHEYGHTFDSRIFGFSYFFAIGIPSASGADWTEIRANNNAWNYLRKHKLLDSWEDAYGEEYPLKKKKK